MIHLQFSWSYCHLVEDQGALFTQQKDKEKVSDSCWQCYKIHMQTLTSNSIVNYLLVSKKLGKIASQIFAVTDEKKKSFLTVTFMNEHTVWEILKQRQDVPNLSKKRMKLLSKF